MINWTENPDEIVLEDVKMFHLESMNERTLEELAQGHSKCPCDAL